MLRYEFYEEFKYDVFNKNFDLMDPLVTRVKGA